MGLRPTQDDEKRIGPATTLSLPLPSPCHPDRSEAKRRDLRFYGPFLDMFFDGAERLTDLSRDRRLWRGVEEPVPSEAEGTSAVLILPMLLGPFRPPKPENRICPNLDGPARGCKLIHLSILITLSILIKQRT